MGRPDFPDDWRGIATAHRDALEIWRRVKDLEWTCVSPPEIIEPGQRTGAYRVAHNDLVVDHAGRSWISMEDFACAVMDTLENGTHAHERITVGY